MSHLKLNLKNIAAAVLITVCASLFFLGFGQNKKSSDTEPRPAVARDLPAPGKEPVMPGKVQGAAIWRDPFATPAEISGAKSRALENVAPNPPEIAGGVLKAPAPPGLPYSEALPSLAGIVRSEKRQVAIIRQRGVSRTYSVGEQVGSYRLIQITENAVILENHAGRHSVRLPLY